MVYSCCVSGCLKTSDNEVGLHKFPFDNQILLSVWIIATGRINWLPNTTSRMCDRHFNIDDYKDGNKNNNLIPLACPLLNNPSISVGNDIVKTDSNDLLDKPNYGDMPFCNNAIISDSSEDRIRLQTEKINNGKMKRKIAKSTCLLLNTEPLCSTMKGFDNIHWVTNRKCAVLLCNQRFRLKFDELFFIDFPKDKKICDTWWRACGRNDKFDPSFKICSIHFDVNDFTTITVNQDNELSKQIILKNINIVPTNYFSHHQFTQFIRKRKTAINDNSKEKKPKK